MNTPTNDEIGNWPLWRVCLKEMRSLPNYGYGLQLDTAWFEQRLNAKRDTAEFDFQMVRIHKEVEEKDGYYLEAATVQKEDDGERVKVYQIPSGGDHQDRIASSFKSKMLNYSRREAHILKMTLSNESAGLSESEKSRAEAKLRIAATRLVLLRREKSVHALIAKTAPKLMEAKS